MSGGWSARSTAARQRAGVPDVRGHTSAGKLVGYGADGLPVVARRTRTLCPAAKCSAPDDEEGCMRLPDLCVRRGRAGDLRSDNRGCGAKPRPCGGRAGVSFTHPAESRAQPSAGSVRGTVSSTTRCGRRRTRAIPRSSGRRGSAPRTPRPSGASRRHLCGRGGRDGSPLRTPLDAVRWATVGSNCCADPFLTVTVAFA